MQPYVQTEMASFTSKDGTTPFKLLLDLELLDWTAVYLGVSHGWVNRENVRDFAALQLADGIKTEGAATLADNESLSFDDLILLVFKQIKKPGALASYEIWRFALLLYIRQSDASIEKKLTQIHRVFVQFNYPNDMFHCTDREACDTTSLAALNDLIEEMRPRFKRHPRKLKH